jgi:hypothetical protein
LEYFTDIWDISWSFGTFCVHLVHFSGFGFIYLEKSGNPGCCQTFPNRMSSNDETWQMWQFVLCQQLDIVKDGIGFTGTPCRKLNI